MSTYNDHILTNRRRTEHQDELALRYVLAHGAEDCLDAIFGRCDDE